MIHIVANRITNVVDIGSLKLFSHVYSSYGWGFRVAEAPKSRALQCGTIYDLCKFLSSIWHDVLSPNELLLKLDMFSTIDP